MNNKKALKHYKIILKLNYQKKIIPKSEKEKNALEKDAKDYKTKYLEHKDESANGFSKMKMNGNNVKKK